MANAGQNGFFHQHPEDYQIYVSEEMKKQIPEWWKLNGHVEDIHYDTEKGLGVAEFTHNGTTYLCHRYDAGDFIGADYWWQIDEVLEKVPQTFAIGGYEIMGAKTEEEALEQLLESLTLCSTLILIRILPEHLYHKAFHIMNQWELKGKPEKRWVMDSYLKDQFCN